jgi:hypothetical protein
MENPTTTGLTNQLNADATACGSAEITVTNAQGLSTTGYVREPNQGQWVLIGSGVNAVGPVSGVGTYDSYYTSGGAHFFSKTAGRYKLDEIMDDTYINASTCQGVPSGWPPEIQIAETDPDFYVPYDPATSFRVPGGGQYCYCIKLIPAWGGNTFCYGFAHGLTLYEWQC